MLNKKQDKKQGYQHPRSICQYLPWMEYDQANQCVILQDQTVAAVFDIADVSSEAKGQDYLLKLRDGLQGVFQDVFPQYFDHESPWVIQFFVQDELTLKDLYQTVEDYVQPAVKSSKFSQAYLKNLKAHTEWMTRREGMFVDDKVSGDVFRAGQRRVRAVIYRRHTAKMKIRKGRSEVQDLNHVANAFIKKLAGVGIQATRATGKSVYEWLVRWFNPKPAITQGNVDSLLAQAPYDQAKQQAWGHDFTEQLFFSVPKSDEKKGVWWFDDMPHRYLSIQSLSRVPDVGQLTAERSFGSFQYGLFDKFPEGSVFVLTVVIQSQEYVKNHLDRIEETARKSNSTAAAITFEDCQIAKAALERGNYLFPTHMGVYLRGNDMDDLEIKVSDMEALLINNGFHVLHGDYELLPIHSYLNNLPMCYDYQFDKKNMYRSGYVFGKQLANLLPLYGRERGTGHPGIVWLNRGGEGLMIDPLNPEDKDNNSFLMLLGASGAGKSSMSIYLLMQVMATRRPHLVITDAGLSFGLLLDYFKSLGLKTHRVEINIENPPVLNPFADSLDMLKQVEGMTTLTQEKKIRELTQELEKDVDAAKTLANHEEKLASQDKRDYMGEMALACQLMITGGEQVEVEKLTRQDRMLIIDALIRAAKASKEAGHQQMIASDVVDAFHVMARALEKANKEPEKVLRIREMADSLNFFCKDALSAKIFNQRGKPWPEVDVTLFEQGIFKDEGYEAHNVLAFMGLMNRTMSRAEKNQSTARDTIFFVDEAHTILKNSLTSVYLTKCAKMARKLGLWLWMATQNVSDFANDAKKILSMMEFWICLGMSEAELSQIEEFRSLTEEEKQLFRSVRKSNKKYVEGVLLCNRLKALFRNIPPRLALALAMTEKHEKAERQQLMTEHHITELEAVYRITEAMLKK